MDEHRKIREELAYWGRRIQERGLVVGPGGNTSARVGEVIYVKPSGFAFEQCGPDDYVGVSLRDGAVVFGSHKPTCEIWMHIACYQTRPDITAVVHTHPPYATGLASSGAELRPMFPDFVAILGRVPTLPYIAPAGKELADAVAKVIAKHDAALLGNHGVIAVGANLREAFYRNELLEEAAKTLVAARVLGEPRFFTDEEIDAIEHLEAEDYRRALLKKQG